MTNKVIVYSKPLCPYCDKAKALLSRMNIEFENKMLDTDFTREDLMEVAPTARTFPQVFINGKNVGGYEQLKTYIETTNFNGTGFSL